MSSVPPESLVVSPEDRDTLGLWIRMPTAAQRLVLRSRIVLMLAEGHSAREVARRLGVSRHTVDLWRARYLQEGSDTLRRDRPGRGRKPAACAAIASASTASASLRVNGHLSAEGRIHQLEADTSHARGDQINLARHTTAPATRLEPGSHGQPMNAGPVIFPTR